MIPQWLFRRTPPPPMPDAPFVAIGDIHGRDDLLGRALDRTDMPVVCVGDYIDRGTDSAGVLRRLAARPDIVCLMGNHEEMLLDFLDAPSGRGTRWLHHGGAQTLESFGLVPPSPKAAPEELANLRDALCAALGEELLAWLRALPSIWVSGNVAVVHAAADPARPIEDQETDVLRWGHRNFPDRQRRDNIWIIHGHVIVDEAFSRRGVMSIDTGAWATDRLTLVHVSGGEIHFEEA